MTTGKNLFQSRRDRIQAQWAARHSARAIQGVLEEAMQAMPKRHRGRL